MIARLINVLLVGLLVGDWIAWIIPCCWLVCWLVCGWLVVGWFDGFVCWLVIFLVKQTHHHDHHTLKPINFMTNPHSTHENLVGCGHFRPMTCCRPVGRHALVCLCMWFIRRLDLYGWLVGSLLDCLDSLFVRWLVWLFTRILQQLCLCSGFGLRSGWMFSNQRKTNQANKQAGKQTNKQTNRQQI